MSVVMIANVLPAAVALAVGLEYAGMCCTRLARRIRRTRPKPKSSAGSRPGATDEAVERMRRPDSLSTLRARELPPVRFAAGYRSAEAHHAVLPAAHALIAATHPVVPGADALQARR